MNKILALPFALLLVPSLAWAHAVPLESSPASSDSLTKGPTSVEIRFSERIDVGASRIRVTGPSGEPVESGRPSLVENDPYRIAVPVASAESGAYVVEWNVVSQDDGHFTKGAFPYAVGEGVRVDPSLASDTEIVQIATAPEVTGMTIELFGHGLLWAVLILFAFVARPLLRSGGLRDDPGLLHSAYGSLALAGAGLAVIGGALQVWFKSRDLAVLHGSGFFEALTAYATTAAGEATLYRMLAAMVFAALVYIFRRHITRSLRITWQEGLLFAVLALFAYERAKVSHATANHFYPDVSVWVNFVHLIEKDIWAGILAIVLLALLFRRSREYFPALIGPAFVLLSANVAAVAVTASYIVWLHMRSLENLFTTKWGIAFMQLLVVAVLLVIMRTYHTLAHARSWRVFGRLLPATLAIELVLAVLVIYASSVVIITSPPAQESQTPVYRARSEGALIQLDRYRSRDRLMRVRIESPHQALEPAATLRPEAGTPVEIQLDTAYPGTYVFPAALIDASTAYTLDVRVPQKDAYDAVASFDVPQAAFDADRYPLERRSFDTFTLIMISIAVSGLAAALALLSLARRAATFVPDIVATRHGVTFVWNAFMGATVTLLAMMALMQLIPALNHYKTLCESDGNMWHVMLPMRAGVPVSLIPREGCMWGMGAYQYMFPEQAEYEHYRSLPEPSVHIDLPTSPRAGERADITVSVKDPDGSPATLFVDMEKLVHLVIVSRDQTVFAHIHPDDERALTEEEKRTATFHLSYVFPKAGEYLLSVDYASGVTLRSSQVPVVVAGSPLQASESARYSVPSSVDGFDVSLTYSQPFAGGVSTLVYDIRTNGKPAELEPYLSAAMHIAIVKNDFEAFAHVHGEVHPPGAVLPPVIVRDGKLVHSMAAMATPARFSYPIDAHVIFPEPGLYTVWGQFQSAGEVHAIPFTVRVEE